MSGIFRKHYRIFLVFLDVDLVDSLRTCFTYLWPLLQDGCYLFTHEAHHMEIAGLFFHEEWWRSQMHCGAPGLIGAGTGLGLLPSSGGFGSALGYTVIARLNERSYRRRDERDYDQKRERAVGVQLTFAVGDHQQRYRYDRGQGSDEQGVDVAPAKEGVLAQKGKRP